MAGFGDGEEFDRHCEVSGVGPRCLVRPPRDYKIPMKWPLAGDIIWSGNLKLTKDQFLASGSITKRLILLEENQIAFHSDDGRENDSVDEYSHQIAKMIGLKSYSEFLQAGVCTVLDIGCGFGSFGAHLLSLNIMTMCIAAYEASGSEVQIALERGLLAMIGSFSSKQLPCPSLSFDMIHCAQCGIMWRGIIIRLCEEANNLESHYQPLLHCVLGNSCKRWFPRQSRTFRHVDFELKSDELSLHDHRKRPGGEDPLPPFNMIRNVMDMNSHYGGLNAALLEARKSVWVMNVVPIRTQNMLPLIFQRGFIGILHDWCKPFPTYPRTYDMLHAAGLLSHILISEECDVSDVFVEMDRILRPEGWVILRDKTPAIEKAYVFAVQYRWDARVITLQDDNDQRLLVCQKPFLKK